jgi:hypothetical protein
MKKTLLFSIALTTVLWSCGGKTEHNEEHEGHEMEHSSGVASDASQTSVSQNTSTSALIDSYLGVKDALVADDQAAAATKSQDLVASLKAIDIASSEDPEELERLQSETIRFAGNLAQGDIASQRESFQALSVNMKEILKITGSDRTLYHQYCPMYKNNTGGMWLSASEDIKNPLFGSSMLTCGSVKDSITIN